MKTFKILQVVLLYAGTVFAWYNVYLSFVAFYINEGSILKFQNCSVANPLLTPCFWGALGFLVAAIWVSWIFLQTQLGLVKLHQRRIIFFLIACTVFGFGNVIWEAFTLNQASGGQILACGGKTISSVFQSGCFYGSIIFLLSLLVTMFIYNKLKQV